MLKCDALDPLVTPFIDGELPVADRRAVEDHLCACAPCHSRIAAEQAVRDLIRAQRAALCTRPAPDALHARCAELTRRPASDEAGRPHVAPSHLAPSHLAPSHLAPSHLAPSSRAGARWPTRLAPYALAASLVLVVGGAFLYQATDRSARLLAAELTADHVKCFAMNSALGTHQAPAAVERSMASTFDWRMHLPDDPASAGLELVGARPCLYAEGKIAHIMYRHDGHPVSLFMLPKTARAEELVEVLGHEASIWCVNNRTFVLVSREPRRVVQRMASFVQASMR
jgi:anti-sigma factor RsiW